MEKGQVRFIKRKGSAGPFFQLTPVLQERVNVGDFEIVTEEELKTFKDKKETVAPDPRFIRRKGVLKAPILPWSAALAAIKDFEEVTRDGIVIACESEETQEDMENDAGVPFNATQFETPVIVESNEEVKPDSADGNIPESADDIAIRNANRQMMIMNVIKSIDPDTEYTTPAFGRESMPKLEILSEKIGFKVSATERNAAWEALKEEGK